MRSSFVLGICIYRTGWARNEKGEMSPTLPLGAYTGGQFQPRAMASKLKGEPKATPQEGRCYPPRRVDPSRQGNALLAARWRYLNESKTWPQAPIRTRSTAHASFHGGGEGMCR